MSKKKDIIEFDSNSLNFGNLGGKVKKWVWRVLAFFLITLVLTIILYCIFALFFKTDTEKQLQSEISMYEKLYPMFAPRKVLIEDAISLLQYKDNEIYEEVFNSVAPNVDPMGDSHISYAVDTIPDTRWTSYTRDKSNELIDRTSYIDEAFLEIFELLSDKDLGRPPMLLPVSDISYPQIGASAGFKFNPFYKAYVRHNGLDIIVTRGSDVVATDSGIVTDAAFNRSSGNTIKISHSNGYKTVYAHLEKMNVRKGQSVKAGQKIGNVGMSGNASAPHLHYEVYRDSVLLDPIDCIFASVSPQEYTNMLYMSVNTNQSLD